MGLCETCGTICPFYIEHVECDNYKPKTNEDWFCQLSTEEKAEWLYYHSGAMSSKGDWEDWLKEKHREEKTK